MNKTNWVASLLREGWPDEVIADEVGVHRAYVRTVRRRRNIPLIPAPTPNMLRQSLEDILSAKTLAEAKRIASQVLRKPNCQK